MKCLLLTLSLISFTNKLFSQSSYFDINAVVTDQNDNLVFGNIIALSPSDSSIIKGAYFLDGKAELLALNQPSVLVKLSSLGCKDTIIEVNNSNNEKVVSLGTVVLKSSGIELGAVEITATIPLFEPLDGGGVKMNVEKTMLSSSTSTQDILAKSPNVIVSDQGVSVVGKGEAIILLDGIRITRERLEAIPVSQISHVEIITNPAAKYDADGNAVINIITKKNSAEGLLGSVTQNTITGKYLISSTSASINYRKGKFSLVADGTYTTGTDYNITKEYRVLATDSGNYTSNWQLDEVMEFPILSNYRLGTKYDINDRSSASLEYNGSFMEMNLDNSGSNAVTTPDGSGDMIILSRNNGNTQNLNHSYTGNYNLTTDTLGSSLFIGAQHSQFRNTLSDLITEKFMDSDAVTSEAERKNEGSNAIDITSVQADLTQIFKGGSNLEYGAKHTMTSMDGKVSLFSRFGPNEEWIPYTQFSNDFSYDESTSSAYMQYYGNKGSLNYSAGIRGEYYGAKGISNVLNMTIIDTTYLNLFPQVRAGYQKEEVGYEWIYSRKIERPRFQDMDPFVWYIDSLNSMQGNPSLLPQIVNNFEGSISYRQYSFSLGYSAISNSLQVIRLPGNNGVNSIKMQMNNIQMQHSFYTTFSVPFELKWWKSYNTISGTLNKFEDDRPTFEISGVTPMIYVSTYNQFSLPKGLKLELIGEYISQNNDGIYNVIPIYSIDIAATKMLLKNKLLCRFMVNDALRTYKTGSESTIGGTKTQVERWRYTHMYTLTLSYQFGKLKDVNYTNKSINDDDVNRIKQ